MIVTLIVKDIDIKDIVNSDSVQEYLQKRKQLLNSLTEDLNVALTGILTEAIMEHDDFSTH